MAQNTANPTHNIRRLRTPDRMGNLAVEFAFLKDFSYFSLNHYASHTTTGFGKILAVMTQPGDSPSPLPTRLSGLQRIRSMG